MKFGIVLAAFAVVAVSAKPTIHSSDVEGVNYEVNDARLLKVHDDQQPYHMNEIVDPVPDNNDADQGKSGKKNVVAGNVVLEKNAFITFNTFNVFLFLGKHGKREDHDEVNHFSKTM